MVREKIENLLEKRFEEDDFSDCFVTEIKQNNTKLEVYVDSDDNMSFDKCTKISRFLESHLDENGWLGEAYTLEVSSPGSTKPLVNIRQYPKHIGRKVEVKTTEGEKFKGELVEVKDETISVFFIKTKKQGKKKIKTEITEVIAYDQIEEIKVKISF